MQFTTGRRLHELTTFAADSQQPTRNPLSYGFAPSKRIDALEIQIDGQIKDQAAAATSLTFDSRAQYDALLDAIISQVRLYSSAVGEVVRSLSLSEIEQCANMMGEHASHNFPAIGDSATNGTFGTYDFSLIVRLPWKLNNSKIAATYAPRCGQFTDGGLSFKTGSGSVTIGADTYDVQSSTVITCRLRGADNAPVVKSSPILYERVNQSGRDGREFSSGLYLGLQDITTDPTTAYGTAGSGDGVRIEIDGETVYSKDDWSSLAEASAMIDGQADSSGWREQYAGDMTGGSPLTSMPTPIIFVGGSSHPHEVVACDERLVLNVGTNFSSTSDYLSARVKPVAEVGSTADVRGGGAPLAPKSLPAQLVKYAPQVG